MKPTLLVFAAICFSLNTYSQTPGWLWSKGIGSTGTDRAYALFNDAAGNIYATGSFDGTVDFDPSPGVTSLTSSLGPAGYILKMDAYGNFIWAKVLTSNTGFAEGSAIRVDAAGNVYSAGLLYGTVDLDPGPGIYNLSSISNSDIYILKLDNSGNFQWAKAIVGTDINGNPPLLSMALDEVSGNVYTAGLFSGTVDFDPSSTGTNTITSNGDSDAFILKLDASGNFVWAKTIGGSADDVPNGIALDPSGNIYCTGRFNGTADFDPGSGTFNITSTGSTDVFLMKLDAAGNLMWANHIGSSTFDIVYALASDNQGNIYTTGDFGGTMDFDPGAGTYPLTATGSDDTFIAKMNSADNLVWAKAIGSSGLPISHAIDVDSSQNVYVTGYYSGATDFDPGPGVQIMTAIGSFDIFVCKLDASGNFSWAKSAGGTGVDNQFAAAFNANQNGSLYIAGDFYNSACSFDSIVLPNSGSADIYIAKIGTCSAGFSISPDSVPHNWNGITLAEGVQPISYTWNWGDGTPNSSGPNPTHTYTSSGNFNICLSITDAVGCTSTYCDSSTYLFRNSNSGANVTVNFTLPSTVDIQYPQSENNLILSAPNPASTYFTLYGNADMKVLGITNSLGEKQPFKSNGVSNIITSSTEKTQIKVDVANWNPGVYFVKVASGKKVVTQKVVVYR